MIESRKTTPPPTHPTPSVPSPARPIRTSTLLAAVSLLATLSINLGCGQERPGTGLRRGPQVTDVDPKLATPDFWWDKPAQATISVPDFDKAVDACRDSMHFRMFDVDRFDARTGTLTSLPVVASQWFEPWRQDNTTPGDVLRSSLATYRRTIRFDITRNLDGRYTVAPKVLVEREVVIGRRLTGALEYRLFTQTDPSAPTLQNDEGRKISSRYWYAVGRDYNMELDLIKAVVGRLY